MRNTDVVVTDQGPTVTVATDDLTRPSTETDEQRERMKHVRGSWGISILLALKNLPHIYPGTVDPVTKQERRVKNRVARKSRRINRKRGA